jgi:hypothetical protein
MNPECISSFEKGIIQRELSKAIEELIQGCESLDLDRAFRMFSDSPDFLMMATDGTLCDYPTYLANNVNYLRTCSRFRLTTRKQEIRILNPEAAVLAWAYRAEAELRTGERDVVDDAGASFVFRKIRGEWKVVYYHESSSPPRRESRVQR